MRKSGTATRHRGLVLAVTLVAAVESGTARAQTIGMVVNDDTGSATVFDSDTDTVLGTVFLPSGHRLQLGRRLQ